LTSVDSYGWVERLTNGPKAAAYNRVIDKVEPSEIVTSSIVLYEVYRRAKLLRDEQKALEAIATIGQTLVVPVDQTIALEAADYSLEHSLHMADAIVYATARHHEAELYTSDEQLKHLKGVVFI